MPLEINDSIDTLQLRHPETNKWVEGTILLQIEGGFGVRLVPAQIERLNQLLEAVQSLKTSTNQSTTSSTEENAATLAQLQEIQAAINLAVDKSERVGQLNTAVGQLKEVSAKNLTSSESSLQTLNKAFSILQQVYSELKDINNLTSGDQSGTTLDSILTVSNTLEDRVSEVKQQLVNILTVSNTLEDRVSEVKQQLVNILTTSNTLKDRVSEIKQQLNDYLKPCLQYLKLNKANNVLTETISLVANTVKTYDLPENTESLVFSCRKNTEDKSFDIQYSLNTNGIQGTNYATLWAYNEYNKSQLNFNGKFLYLKCETAVQIEITTYFCT